ncbi:PHP N-terminal domain protein [Bathymodiolus brooksi thiotrophic gill symbiont]|nr:PHP N-terminal domain protein [Bathymodiolus brooksi thiotrophic gill symbiont]
MTQSNEFSGAKWWKFDFHTHTPASSDFMQSCSNEDRNSITPELWLTKFINEGIDCVAITDHNSGVWIDKLKGANDRLEKKIHLFPGVEISVHGGVHILAIFGPEKTTSDIDTLLGAVDYKGTKGRSDGVTTKSITKVIDIITQQGGIAIPAHADKEKGLFGLHGNTLTQVLNNKNIHAMELCDETYDKPQLYQDQKIQWSEVLGSDTHNFRDNCFDFTWIKMDTPSIEGLKLALIDGEASVDRNMDNNPNQHTQLMIESLEINKAKYIGKKKRLECEFSPFLNTIIGGRGSGKSTMLEFMRFVFRRNKELPESIRSEFNKYFEVGDDNLLTDESELSLVYQKEGSRYRLNWSADAQLTSLEIDENGDWQATDGEISSLFPVQIYSQKQIFELSKNPQSLLEIIDKDVQVKFSNFKETRRVLTHKYKQIRQKISEINEQISQKDKLNGELNYLNIQINQIEKSGHKHILQTYRQRQRQLASIEHLEKTWQTASEILAKTVEEIAPIDLDNEVFTPQDELTKALQIQQQKWQKMTDKVVEIKQEASATYQQWQQQKQQRQWRKDIDIDIDTYQEIKTQLEQQGIDPEKYSTLLQFQAIKKSQLGQMDAYQRELEGLDAECEQIKVDIQDNREQLTQNRQAFLETVLQGNDDISIRVLPYKEGKKSLEKKVRKILQCGDKKYSKDIDNLMLMESYQDLKDEVEKIYQNKALAKDQRFHQHLYDLPQESLSDFGLWHPEDSLKITFSKGQALETGSAGQKCAALLAFILSYGSEPLLLDQPEDDLDNELIYKLIVKQIRATKHKRQIIIVTHNANIVVNGNAEMVVPMTVGGGQSYISKQASIQNNDIRKKICTVLEGGEKAFSHRYRRIHLEGENV